MTEKIQGGRRGHMMRWAFLEGFDIGADGDPYLDRLRIFQTPWFGVYLHHIHRADRERDPHDHPWAFFSVVLAGSYSERVWPDKHDSGVCYARGRNRWSVARLGRKAAHIITRIDGPLWTLVFTGPRRGDWGFWRDNEFIPWRDYIVPAEPGTEPGHRLVREIISSGPPEGLTVSDIQRTMGIHGMPSATRTTLLRWLMDDREHGLADIARGAWIATPALMSLLEGTPPEDRAASA